MPASISRAHAARRAFTLIELLVVITIIGILVSLLLPAVQAARSAARRAQCINNMKNLGLALQNYHSALKTFPPSVNVLNENPGTISKWQRNWVIDLLPYLEQQNLYQQFNFAKHISDAENLTARTTELSVMLCPSDMNAHVKFNEGGADDGDWSRGNYGANGALAHTDDAVGRTSAGWINGWQRGVMGCNVSVGIDGIRDGSSNTILLAELRIGQGKTDRRGVWAMGSAGSSAIFGHSNDDGLGPNYCAPNSGDNVQGCAAIIAAVGLEKLQMECMTCCQNCTGDQGIPRSRHSGGLNVCMADGSVHFISNFIEKSTAWTLDPENLFTWERLNASNDGMPIDASKW